MRGLPGLARVQETVISGRLVNRSLAIDSRHLSECAQLWASGEFTQLVLSSYRDAFNLRSLEFLADFPAVTSLQISLGYEVDLKPLEAHAQHLKAFFANDGINGIRDVAPYTQLVSLGQPWREGMRFPSSMNALEKMAWTNFKPQSKAIGVLPQSPRLKSLGLVSTNITSLAGVERYPTLESLSVCGAAQLSDVSALQSLTAIHTLSFEDCKKLANVAGHIRHLNLEELGLIKCGVIPSIGFVQELRRLRKFVFLDTDVAEGDMSMLLAHPALAHVAFTRKKHFSHSERDVMKARMARSERSSTIEPSGS